MSKPKIFPLLTAVLVLALLSACSPAESPPADPGSSSEVAAPADPPTATPESSAAGVVSEASGACNNPFYPIRGDTAWTYQIVQPESKNTQGSFTLSYENLTGESFETLMTLRDPESDQIFQARGTWYCSEEGIVSSEFNTFSFVTLGDVSVETLDYDGFSLLPEDQWELNATWPSDYQVNASFTVEETSVTSSMSISLVSTITAIEEVTVSAGSYPEAYRVDTVGVMDLDLEGVDAVQSSFPIEYSTWYVRNVGMVKQQTTGEAADGTYTELISVE